jgi:hypothetical protein
MQSACEWELGIPARQGRTKLLFITFQRNWVNEPLVTRPLTARASRFHWRVLAPQVMISSTPLQPLIPRFLKRQMRRR